MTKEKKMFGRIEYTLDSETKCKHCKKKLRWWIEPEWEDMQQDKPYFTLDEVTEEQRHRNFWFCSEDCFLAWLDKQLGEPNPPEPINLGDSDG